MRISIFPPLLAAYLLALAFVLGAVLGSALCCLAWRMVHHRPWLRGRSVCGSCGHTLAARDLIPVFSYLFLRGRCRYCGQKIGALGFWAELGLGLYFAAALWVHGLSVATLQAVILACLLLPDALCDLETFELPDRFAALGLLAWLALLPLAPGGWRAAALQGLLGAAGVALPVWLVSLAVGKKMGTEAMGGGDIKLYALAGLYLGFAANLLNVLVSCIFGLMMAAAARTHAHDAQENTPKAEKDPENTEKAAMAENAGPAQAEAPEDEIPDRAFPFGPAIALSTLLCLLFAEPVVHWYLGFF